MCRKISWSQIQSNIVSIRQETSQYLLLPRFFSCIIHLMRGCTERECLHGNSLMEMCKTSSFLLLPHTAFKRTRQKVHRHQAAAASAHNGNEWQAQIIHFIVFCTLNLVCIVKLNFPHCVLWPVCVCLSEHLQSAHNFAGPPLRNSECHSFTQSTKSVFQKSPDYENDIVFNMQCFAEFAFLLQHHPHASQWLWYTKSCQFHSLLIQGNSTVASDG